MPLTRRLILQKARRHPPPTRSAQAPTDCKRTVSGTLSLPSRGTFHLSLTVLVRYRSPGSIQAYRVVPADSQQISRARCYLGTLHGSRGVFVYGTLTRYGRPFQTTSTNTHGFSLPPVTAVTGRKAPQPHDHIPCRVSHDRCLASSAFARHYSRNHTCFLFLWVLRCFTSPRSLPTPYTFRRG